VRRAPRAQPKAANHIEPASLGQGAALHTNHEFSREICRKIRRMRARLGFVAWLLWELCTAFARADDLGPRPQRSDEVWLAAWSGPIAPTDAAALALAADATRWLATHDLRARSIALADAATVEIDRLQVLKDAENALITAREHTARLEERKALEVLVQAERGLLAELDLPGAHAWLAELWIAMAIVAAQREEHGLAMSWLARAASVDPERRIGAAEAPPPLIALAEIAARARDAAVRSRFRVESEPADAQIFIDGLAVDPGREWVTAPGVHVLRATAPGYRPYAALIDVLSGSRSPLRILLSEIPGTRARRALAQPRMTAQDAERIASSLSAETAMPVWLFESAGERVLVVSCQREGCTPQAALGRDDRGMREDPLHPPTRGWLTKPPAPVRTADRQPRRLWPWLAASGVLITTGFVTSLAARDPGTRRERELIVDPGSSR
jgi:hypothetical protein